MKIINAHWFCSGRVGIVIGIDEVTKETKAYAGLCEGNDEKHDIKQISSNGTPVMLLELKQMIKEMEG